MKKNKQTAQTAMIDTVWIIYSYLTGIAIVLSCCYLLLLLPELWAAVQIGFFVKMALTIFSLPIVILGIILALIIVLFAKNGAD